MVNTALRRDPDRAPTHPGTVLQMDVLPALGMTTAQAAERLHVTRQALHSLLTGKSAMSVDMALRVSRAFGGSPGMWLAMQQARDLWEAERSLKDELATIEPVAA